MVGRPIVLIVFASFASAQDPFASASPSSSWPQNGTERVSTQPLTGSVSPASPGIDRLVVEVASLGDRGPAIQTPVRHDGSFEFLQLPAGSYEVRLRSLSGETIVKAYASVPSGSDLLLQLPAAARAAAPVSLYRLSHKVPSKARRLLQKAAKAHDRRDSGDTFKNLDAALALDPDYADALHLRGIAMLRSGNYPEAHLSLARAASLDDANPAILSAASAAAFIVGKTDEADRLAHATLRLHPGNPTATIVLDKLGVLAKSSRPRVSSSFAGH